MPIAARLWLALLLALALCHVLHQAFPQLTRVGRILGAAEFF
jgi:hypothetical protein